MNDDPPKDFGWCDMISNSDYTSMRPFIDTCSATCPKPWLSLWSTPDWCDSSKFYYTQYPNVDDNLQNCPSDIGCPGSQLCTKCTKQ